MKKINLIIFLLLTFTSLNAQFYYFGRNKVQYEKFEWKVLRTTHFDIYYYDDLKEIAEIGSAFAENAYKELKSEFNHTILRRIPLIFYNTHLHFQQTNTTPGFIPEGVGGFFEFIKGRVVIPFNGSLNEFEHVIRHELVHVFMVNKIARILSDHRQPQDRLPPLWFVEGLAEFLSTKPDAQYEMVMRDAVINGYVVGINDMYKIQGSFLMYKEGQSFLEYVAEKYGRYKVLKLIDNFWMFENFEKVIEYTLDNTIEEIDNDWLFYLKRKYFPLLTDKYIPGFEAERITGRGFYFSPKYYEDDNGKYIYVIGNNDGYTSIFRYSLLDNKNKKMELVLRGEKKEELESFHLFQPSLSVSKKGIIAFITKVGETDAVHFYSIKENKILKRFQLDELITITSPSFNEDGNKLLFQAVDNKGYSDIYLLNSENFSLERLTNDYYDDRNPIFGLNDNQIIFSSDRTAGENKNIYNLFSLDSEDLNIKYLTYLPYNTSSPFLSPSKDELLFISEIDEVKNIWQSNISDYGINDTLYRVTSVTTSIFYPSFINNSQIAYTAFENFSFGLYINNYSEKAENDYYLMKVKTVPGVWLADKINIESIKENLNYENEYTIDYAQSQIITDPIYGTRGGAILSLSDLFGDDNYFFILYNTAEVQSDILKSFNVALTRVNLGERTNYSYGIFHFSGRRYDIRESEEFYFERSFGGNFALSFPLSKFARIEAATTIANSDKQIISGFLERKALLLNNSLSYVFDNSLWGPSGPVDGSRIRLLLSYTSDIKFSNVNYFTVIADYRTYFRFDYRSLIAFRSALFYNEGKEARRFFMGGSWDLRGWNRWSIRGEKLWLSSVELRFPLIDQINIQFPFVELGFSSIRGALFFDSGGAWDKDYKETLGSYGGGIRLNLFNVIVLRYDIGKKIENDFTKIQSGLFHQFFFGWDF